MNVIERKMQGVGATNSIGSVTPLPLLPPFGVRARVACGEEYADEDFFRFLLIAYFICAPGCPAVLRTIRLPRV